MKSVDTTTNPPSLDQSQSPSRIRSWLPNIVFGFLLSGIMSLIISAISTARTLGIEAILAEPGTYLSTWMVAYFPSWAIAFPVVLVVAPSVRKIVSAWFAPTLPDR